MYCSLVQYPQGWEVIGASGRRGRAQSMYFLSHMLRSSPQYWFRGFGIRSSIHRGGSSLSYSVMYCDIIHVHLHYSVPAESIGLV